MNDNQSLVTMIETALENDSVDLPVFDQVAQKIYDSAQNNTITTEELCELLMEDPICVSEVLRMSNSSFFSGLTEIDTLADATVRLGIKQVAALVMSISQKRLYSASDSIFHTRLLNLWQHISTASLAARWIAKTAGYRSLSDQVHVAALLHDVGKLSLLRIIEEISSKQDINFSDELIDSTLEKLYCAHGARLLEIWELPTSLCTTIADLEKNELEPDDISLAIVRLADKACAKEGVSDYPDPDLCLESLPETQFLGLDDIAIAELCIAIEDARSINDAQNAA